MFAQEHGTLLVQDSRADYLGLSIVCNLPVAISHIKNAILH